jgi:hypothetical protein
MRVNAIRLIWDVASLGLGAVPGLIRGLLDDIAAGQLEPPAACWAQHWQWHSQAGRSRHGFEIGAVVRAHHEVHPLQDTPHRAHVVLARRELSESDMRVNRYGTS